MSRFLFVVVVAHKQGLCLCANPHLHVANVGLGAHTSCADEKKPANQKKTKIVAGVDGVTLVKPVGVWAVVLVSH